MRTQNPRLSRLVLLLEGLLLVLSTQTIQAQVATAKTTPACSAPYFVEQSFPLSGQKETSWQLCWQSIAGNGLVITSASFQKSPGSPFVKLFGDARVSDIFVPYHNPAILRYLDVGYGFPLISLNTNDCPPSKAGALLGNSKEVCKELRDRGLAWKDHDRVRRGEELVLWSVIDAGNYNNVIEWTFRDDGVVMGRLGATGQNHPYWPYTAHMHGVIWRLDIDLNGAGGDSAYLWKHTEQLPGGGALDTMKLIKTEAGLEWNPSEFTSLHIQDATLKNANGNSSVYQLMPLLFGKPRHQESFTKYDFWVTRNNGNSSAPEMAGSLLPSYISPPQSVVNTDIVVWYYGGAHHLPRDEDGQLINREWKGEAHIMWSGFMLMPHNLFDKTPLFP
jgi:primary-amine oxidase